jgi:hypothetical protein
LHHFPSRVWLDAAVLRCCLFPVHFGHSATSIELGWSWCNLASDIKFLFTTDASLQARNSGGRGAILRLTKKTYSLQSLRYKHRTRLRLKQRCLLRCVPLFIYGLFCRPLSGTTSLPEWDCACYAAFLCSLTAFFVGRCLAPLPFQSGAVLVTLRILVHYEFF